MGGGKKVGLTMTRLFEKDYRVRESDDVLTKTNKINQDVDQRLDAIEQIAAEFRAGNRVDVDGLVNAINSQIAARAAQIQALIDEQAEGYTPDRIAETPEKRFTSDAEILGLSGDIAALAAAAALLAPLQSPNFTGLPTAPTADPGNNSNLLATTAFVRTALNALVSTAPGQLDTLAELATALGNDGNFASTVLSAIGGKQPASGLLSSIAGVTAAANKLFYMTGPTSVGLADLSTFFRTLMPAANAAAIYATLGPIPIANIPATLTPDKAFRRGNILGTVAQVAGVATGGIIERGRNANGDYVRFADGTQKCTLFPAVFTRATASEMVFSWTYPATFFGTPSGTIALDGLGSSISNGGAVIYNDFGNVRQQSGGATADYVVTRSAGGLAFPVGMELLNCKIQATGRWF